MSRRLGGALLALVLLAAACGGDGITSVRGRVVEVDGDLLTVERFAVVTDDGERLEFVPVEGLTFVGGVPLSHLQEHLRDGFPVLVDYKERSGGTLVATRVDDG